MEEASSPAAERSAAALRVICGLGNPGAEYAATRHNVGFRVVEELALRRGVALSGDLCRARTAQDGSLVLVEPQTFMNRSGFAARCLRERLAIEPAQILVLYDEIHLPLGRLRLRPKGSPAGHRGMESILENLGSFDVPRLKMGVGGADGPPQGDELVDFVLAPFAAQEEATVSEMIERAADACLVWAEQGMGAAMRAFNGQ